MKKLIEGAVTVKGLMTYAYKYKQEKSIIQHNLKAFRLDIQWTPPREL